MRLDSHGGRRDGGCLNPGPTILVITTIPETMESFFIPQLRSLHQAGFDVRVASSPGPALDRLPLEEGTARYGVPIERSPHPWRDLVSLWRLFRLMLRVHPQIVHAHTPKAGLLGMAAALLARVPVRLYTVHGLPLLTRTGLRRRMLEIVERASGRLATQSYAVSESVRALLAELNLNQRAIILGSGSCGGVDIERFRPQPELRAAVRNRYGIPRDAIIVTFVGRLSVDKGIVVLAEAWPRLADQMPELHLLLAGEPDATDPVPEPALRALRSHPRVHSIGIIPQEQVPSVYAATDIAVLPTYREGLSQMALEAGACEVPLVSTRVSGLDAVVHGVTGLLVRPGSASGLQDSILRLARDPGLRRALSVAARAHIVEHFSESRVNGLWIAEYLRRAGDSRPGVATPTLPAAAGIQKGSHSAT